MDKIEYLYHVGTRGVLNKTDIITLYDLDPKVYDYEHHKRDPRLEEVFKSRNIRKDLATILECPEEQIAFLNEKMSSVAVYLYTGLHIINLQTNEVLNGKMSDVNKFIDYQETNKEIIKEEVKEPQNEMNTLEDNKVQEVKKDNLLERCIKRSLVPSYAKRPYRNVEKEVLKEEVSKKNAVIAKVLVSLGAVTFMGMTLPGGMDETDAFINNHRHIITEEKVRTDDNSGFYYLHSNIAKKILNENEDTDALIYVVYKEVKKDAATIYGTNDSQLDYNMNLIIHDISIYSDNHDYNNFDEYLVSKNFVNQNGAPDEKVYEQSMHDYILKMLNENDLTFDGGKTR